MDKFFPNKEEQNQQNGYYPNGHYQEEEGISLKELLIVLIKGKKVIMLTTVVIVIVAMVGSVIVPNINIGSKGEVQTAVRLYFEGIDEGLTPTGEIYDPNEIKDAETLQRAMDSMAIKNKPSTSELAGCMSLTAVLPDEAAKTLQNISELKTEDLKLERLESLVINPNTYIIKLDVDNDLGLSLEDGRELLDNVVMIYKQQLMEKYSEYTVLADVFAGDFSIDEYDFIQATDLLNEQLLNMEQYVQANMADEMFTSQNTGMSKVDILNSLEATKNVDVEMLYTKIAVAYVTKNATKSVAIYEKLAEDKGMLYEQCNEESTALYDMIVNFKTPEQTLVIGNGAEEPYALKNQNAQYDSMVTRYIQAGVKATNALADSQYYRAEAGRFKEAENLSGPESIEAKEVERLLNITKNNIIKGTKTINAAVTDYYNDKSHQKYAEQLIPTQSYKSASGVNLPLNMAIALVAGIILGVLIVLFREYLKSEEQEVTRNEG